jgi:NADH-quinone oxidoreductase subunit H
VFTNPAALVAFLIFFIAQLAESNRPPFDLPEAESELVAGYLAEYSAFRYAIFFLVEFGNVWIMSAIAVTLFFGGWQVPGVSADAYAAARGAGALPAPAWWGLQVASMVVFTLKTFAIMNLVIWIRWTFPRIRVDQMMNLCWKYLVPGAFVTFIATLLWQILVASVPVAATVSGVALSALALLALVQMLRLTKQNVEAGGDRVDLSNW